MNTIYILLLLLASPAAWAGVDQISEKEFRALAAELSRKVNLFQDAWERDPEAQFYGGTTRDYLYWLKGQFRGVHTREAAMAKVDALRKMPAIDVRSFIIGDSDVDIFSDQAFALRPTDYGVKKIDTQKADVLNPATELGRSEVAQGFIPAEKIRLNRRGLESSPSLGNGVHEIYTGKLSVHFSDPATFRTSKYAAEGVNHPILLSLRYLRLQAINYFNEHGGGAVDKKALLAQLDPASAAAIRKVVEPVLGGEELKPFLAKALFKKWLNAGIQKAFRSYTNPNAAKALMEEFRITELPNVYPHDVEPVNQYVFARQRDESAIAKSLAELRVDPKELYLDPKKEFPDGFLYHGTKSEPAFRGILFQGVLGSENGTAGGGLYGVGKQEQTFAEKWAGDKKRLLRFPVKPGAKIVDITKGEGKAAWERFQSLGGASGYDRFADAVDADILAYPYTPRAYVVKNSEALGHAEGVYRQILPLPEILARSRKVKSLEEFLKLVGVNSLSTREVTRAFQETKIPLADAIDAFEKGKHRELLMKHFFAMEGFDPKKKAISSLLDDFKKRRKEGTLSDGEREALLGMFRREPWRERGELVVKAGKALGSFDALADYFAQPGMPFLPELVEAVEKDAYANANPRYFFRLFNNPDSVSEADRFKKAIKHFSMGKKEASWALAQPHWLGHKKLVRTLLETDAKESREAVDIFFAPAWMKHEPEFLREQWKEFVASANRHDVADVPLLRRLAETKDHPYGEKEIMQLLGDGRLEKVLPDYVDHPGLAPFRKLTLPLLINEDVHLEPADLRRLGARTDIATAQKAMLARMYDRAFGEIWVNGHSRSFIEGCAELSAENPFGARTPAQWNSIDEAALEALERAIPNLANNLSDEEDLPRFREGWKSLSERWSAQPTEGAGPRALLEILEAPPPEELMPFVRKMLRDPGVREKFGAKITEATSFLANSAGYRFYDNDPTRMKALVEILLEQPALKSDRAFLMRMQDLTIHFIRQRRPFAAFPAYWLKDAGALPPEAEAYLYSQRELLEREGFRMPPLKECPTLFQAAARTLEE